MMAALLGLAAIVALGAWAFSDDAEAGTEQREIWLVNGSRYTITWYEPAVALGQGDPMQFWNSLGFCQIDSINLLQNGLVQLNAYWCQKNTLWVVPENVSISEL